MKKVCLSALVLTIALSNFASQALAAQIQGEEGKKHLVKVPARELTRIAIVGGRLQNVKYLTNELEVNDDKAAGVVYVRPLTTEKQISVFVTSASGATHQLVLEPVDSMPLESIDIKDPPSKKPKDAKSLSERASSMDVAVKRLVLAMARGDKDGADAAYEKLDRPMALWDEARFVLTGKYRGFGMTGEAYKLMNVSRSVMRLAEQEFYKPGVLAVAVDQMILKPGEMTDVFVIKVGRDE